MKLVQYRARKQAVDSGHDRLLTRAVLFGYTTRSSRISFLRSNQMKPERVVEFMEKMEPGSVAVFASAHDIKRNHDTDFEFRQDTDFYYLTRLNEPDCVAVLAPSHPEHKYVLFVRPRIREEEIWTGIRTGVEGAILQHGADAAYDISKLSEVLPKYLQNVEKLYYRFGNNEHFDLKIISTVKYIREK